MLYERDTDYRRRLKEQHLAEDQSFGASLRRLRLLRGLRQSDFPGIAAKTVARIERGGVKSPNARTVAILADRLGVEPDQLAEF
ncbi:MAG: helix-turn-helix transcriptional regulator [Deltaproteobacteria bacterium]|nr:helix-turn-helix transcriptional regulator [Deltaproteobacteria bacterium]